jgi:hypothetical protein
MNTLPNRDLFALALNTLDDRPGVRRDEALARMVRARNAALQKPLAYLDNSRNLFTLDEQKLFERINPIQVAQYLLEKISDSMILGQVVPRAEIEEQVKVYVASLDFEAVLTDEQQAAIVRKVVSALSNDQDNNRKFREVIRNEVSRTEEEFTFRLLEIQTSRVSGSEAFFYYMLTQHGVKLLHITWQASDDFDMDAVMIEGSMRSGKYSEAARLIEQCLRSSTRIEAALNDISISLRDQSYEKSYAEQIKVLIHEVEKDAEAFGKIAYHPERLVRKSQEADDLDPHARLLLQEVQRKINHLHRIHSRFTTTISNIQSAFRRFQDDKIGMLGRATDVPDIGLDFLAKLAVLPVSAIHSGGGPADAIAAALFLPRRPVLFDPFVIWDGVRLAEDEDGEAVDEDIGVVEIAPSRNTTFGEMKAANAFLANVIRVRGQLGIRLSEIIGIIDRHPKFTRRQRFIVAHRAAFVSQLFRGYKIVKTDDGTRLVDCPYMNGPDLLLKATK